GPRAVLERWPYRPRSRTQAGLAEDSRPPGVARRRTVRDRGGHAQLDLRSCSDRAAHVELAIHDPGTFAHARKPEVSLHALARQRLRLDPFPVVVDDESKLAWLVVDSDGHAPCLRVLHGVAQRLACDPVRLIAHDGIEIPRLAVDADADRGSVDQRRIRGEL